MKTKECYRCKTEKLLEEFTKVTKNKDGLNIWCRQCVKDRNAEKAAAKSAGHPAKKAQAKPDPKPSRKLAAVPDPADPAHIGPRRTTRTPLQSLLRSPDGQPPKTLRKPLTEAQKQARNAKARERRAAAKQAS